MAPHKPREGKIASSVPTVLLDSMPRRCNTYYGGFPTLLSCKALREEKPCGSLKRGFEESIGLRSDTLHHCNEFGCIAEKDGSSRETEPIQAVFSLWICETAGQSLHCVRELRISISEENPS